MATTRATGYVVTAAVWNALFAGLSDAGVFTGTITTSGAATFSGATAFNGATTFGSTSTPVFLAPASAAIALRVRGRSADDVGIIDFANNAQTTQQAAIRADTAGLTFSTGSTARTFTFSGGRVETNAVQPGFLAYNTADDTGVTNGTDIDFDTEIYDTASNFSADTFTAPVTGRYLLSASVAINNVSGGSLNVGAYIRTSNLPGGFWIGLFDGMPTATQRLFSGSVIVDMDASDTATVRLYSTGAVTVRGDAGGLALTYFCGRLLV